MLLEAIPDPHQTAPWVQELLKLQISPPDPGAKKVLIGSPSKAGQDIMNPSQENGTYGTKNQEVISRPTEVEVHWRQFLEKLLKRGLNGVRLIVSDDHSGLKKAPQAMLPGTAWQRCCFHLAQKMRKLIGKKRSRDSDP